MTDFEHLSADTIEKLSNGHLSPADSKVAAAHLDDCPECRSKLDPFHTLASKDTHDSYATIHNRNAQTPVSKPTTSTSSVLKSGDQLGRYRILRQLGAGGFGRVYLAEDEQLQRQVAIKVPHLEQLSSSIGPSSYLDEARTVAALDHPHIATVFDVGQSERFPVYVVSKFIDGCDLATKIKTEPISLSKSIRWIATLAQALHYAHKHGVVHRDVKPQNILLDHHNKVYLVDFGLALREIDLGRGPRSAGTPSYMSPEQVKGEGHRVDGRSDIFSLGIVLYELLVGRRPFQSDSTRDLFQQIAIYDPKPLRQVNESIPIEVERICFKALAKRASDRYSSAQDFADELLSFINELENSSGLAGGSRPQSAVAAVGTPVNSLIAIDAEHNSPAPIVPKGLRAFDENDADFFIRLLPGPHDRQGFSQNLRFWKNRLESTHQDSSFRVGMIYGPSGCGKSSFVKAGLLPRLNSNIVSIYLEATGHGVERRMQSVIQNALPQFSNETSLRELLTAVRQRGIQGGDRKLLIVIDQFEQWLHGRVDYRQEELTDALRQSDGTHIQVILLVRDDFWLAVSRFLRDLETPVLEGKNCTLHDLFDPKHALLVLCHFGRAFGRLPAPTVALSRDQNAFLERAIADIIVDGKVNPVRLVIVAEMLKNREWSVSALRIAGGALGLGETFLESTFAGPHAPAQYRHLQDAARGVLKLLLPHLLTCPHFLRCLAPTKLSYPATTGRCWNPSDRKLSNERYRSLPRWRTLIPATQSGSTKDR